MAKAKEAEKAKAAAKREVEESGGNEYMGALRTNDNRAEGVDASGIEAAIEALDVAASCGTPGARRSVNLKVLYKEYEERELGRLKVDFPGLKLSQYKERCWAAWQKSPENPMNEQ